MIVKTNLKNLALSGGSFPTRKARNRKYDQLHNHQYSHCQTRGSIQRHQREQCMRNQPKTNYLDLSKAKQLENSSENRNDQYPNKVC